MTPALAMKGRRAEYVLMCSRPCTAAKTVDLLEDCERRTRTPGLFSSISKLRLFSLASHEDARANDIADSQRLILNEAKIFKTLKDAPEHER